jgi:hypothetical protein
VTYTPPRLQRDRHLHLHGLRRQREGRRWRLVTVTVTAVNDPPVARDDAVVGPRIMPVVINVLGNDSDVDSTG